MTRGALVALGCLAIAGPASAQDLSRAVTVSQAIYLAAATFDHVSTARCLQAPGCREANPMYAWMQPAGDATMLGVAAAVDVIGSTAVRKLLGPRHPTLTTTGFLAFSAVRVAQGFANVRNGRAQRTHNALIRALPPPTATVSVTTSW